MCNKISFNVDVSELSWTDLEHSVKTNGHFGLAQSKCALPIEQVWYECAPCSDFHFLHIKTCYLYCVILWFHVPIYRSALIICKILTHVWIISVTVYCAPFAAERKLFQTDQTFEWFESLKIPNCQYICRALALSIVTNHYCFSECWHVISATVRGVPEGGPAQPTSVFLLWVWQHF